jgi:hypothetical protein
MTSGLFARVTFKVSVETVFGDSVFVTGNAPILGNDTAPCPCHSFLVRLPRSMQAAENAFWIMDKEPPQIQICGGIFGLRIAMRIAIHFFLCASADTARGDCVHVLVRLLEN